MLRPWLLGVKRNGPILIDNLLSVIPNKQLASGRGDLPAVVNER